MKTLIILCFTLFLSLISQAQIGNDSTEYKMDSATLAYLSDSIYVTVNTSFEIDNNGNMINQRIEKVNCNNCQLEKIEHFKNEAFKLLDSIPKFEINQNKKRKFKRKIFKLPLSFKLD